MNPSSGEPVPAPKPIDAGPTRPHAPPLYLTSVWECDSPAQADAILGGRETGHVYRRDSHPNAAQLVDQCRLLHGAECAAIAASGMAALAAALLAILKPGDHVLLGQRSYGKTLALFAGEGSRLGITSTAVDTSDLAATRAAFTPATKLLVVETLANPLLQVADIGALAELAHARGALLLVDNTFASPAVCKPLALGADLVMESLTKMMNGHSDVILGMLAGSAQVFERVPAVISTWGFASSPFDCWLASRGLATLPLRMERACANALAAATYLQACPQVARVYYPGLAEHPDHHLAARQFRGQFGSMVAFELAGGRPAADAFIAACRETIPFCPSLGELATTCSHPETTSHRGMSASERAALGITGGVIRLSVGIDSSEYVVASLRRSLAP
jgi:cystathionine beta-lyase/cystathionine gamma-synthase